MGLGTTRATTAGEHAVNTQLQNYEHIEVRVLSPAAGAEISGVDLSQPLAPQVIDDIKRVFLEHLVIFFRDQRLSVEQHKAFGRVFGSLNVHPQYVALDGDPEIFPVVKEATDANNIGDIWHSDISFLPEPALGSMLYAHEVPAEGGDTLFSNQYLAYEALSPGLKKQLSKLRALHSDHILTDPLVAERRNRTRSTKVHPDAIGKPPIESLHPVVRTHPETGRKGLFVNAAFTRHFEGMTIEESRPLLKYLYAHSARPEFTCRFRWREGSIAFWDNRCLLHYALNDYPGKRRYMHRVTVNGDRPS